jgi:hypothetical protein
MATNDLKDKIKNIVRDAVSKTDQSTFNNKPQSSGFEIINSFPKLHDILVTLLTENYGLFVSNILWVAPKPTTFRVTLKNNQYFFLINTERTWIAQVEGKKFYLLNVSEEERAIKSIARILRYGYQELPSSTTPKSTEPEPLSPAEIAANETPASSGEEELTPPEEETPPA